METYFVLKDLAILLLFAKIFALIARRIKCPQVVGQIMAGLLVGPCCLGWVQTSDFLAQIAEIGVVLLMFITGLETDLKKLLKAGPIALLVAVMGVAVPLVCGIGVYGAFYGLDEVGSPQFYKAVFIGVILTATSVSITVAALQEMGKINSFLGTTIIGAAVIDDVIGVIVLTCAIGMSTGSGGLGKVLLNTFLFFLISGVGGFLVYHLAKWYYGKHTRTHRVTIFSLVLCFAMSFCAEHFFGIADITGAYVAGIILCSLENADYIKSKMEVGDYLFFTPIFFASIGLKTQINGMTVSFLLFCVCFVLVALLSKVVGCGLAAKLCRFSWSDSLKVGAGMMTRGEVALIVAGKGLAIGMVEPAFFTAVILLILVSSVVSPIILKMLFNKDQEAGDRNRPAAQQS